MIVDQRLLRRRQLRDAVMIWLSAAMVALSLLALAAVLGLLLWYGLGWLMLSPEEGASEVAAFGGNLYRLLVAPEVLGTAAMLPAIIGTAVMIILMTVIVAPLGVVVAIYLREYARETWYTNLLRAAIQNLAGVPSIIYGVFGLGFFVYFVGGEVDAALFTEQLPRPTFGTPGLLWAALTLALLTLPVVIITTEEGLDRLPESMREGSYALGATRAETVFKVLLPAAAPSVLTGLILAIARAAGEVAPLMLVGVVKFAPALPISERAPFIHLEQKFMHLGFHVYDVAMHASGDGRLGLICAISLMLVALVVLLNLTAIVLRKRLHDRFPPATGL